MAFVDFNPHYRPFLEQHRLTRFDDFLSLPAVIISGHPDRNVARVTLGKGSDALRGFLKREHRVPWRDRLSNAWAGFGFVSKSCREARVLQALHKEGVGCAEWIAVGEDRSGRAFLLLRELHDALDLRQVLREEIISPIQRQELARRLGETVARAHATGFNHPDLYSKHVLVEPRTLSIYFLDWQRSRKHTLLDWELRCRDLAALDATLAEELAGPQDRLTFLHAYFGKVIGLRSAARQIRSLARQLLRKRHIQEARTCLVPLGKQAVIWVDGEALCVTPDFWAEVQGEVPDWLRLDREASSGGGLIRRLVPLPDGRRGLLVRRSEVRPLRWLWQKLRRRPTVSPELREAGLLFRKQRHGLDAPRLLAFGQRQPRPWRTESFLLTEMAMGDGGREA